jgi:hypothetical protein
VFERTSCQLIRPDCPLADDELSLGCLPPGVLVQRVVAGLPAIATGGRFGPDGWQRHANGPD